MNHRIPNEKTETGLLFGRPVFSLCKNRTISPRAEKRETGSRFARPFLRIAAGGVSVRFKQRKFLEHKFPSALPKQALAQREQARERSEGNISFRTGKRKNRKLHGKRKRSALLRPVWSKNQ